MSRKGNDTVAVVFPAPLQPGTRFQLRFSYAGSVISDAGGGLFYVGARGTWYPNRGIAMAHYDLTFRFPRPWSVIATGKRVSLERDGDGFIGHWISEKPIPIAGFNLGEYVHSSAKSGEIAVDAFAARGTEYRRAAPIARDRSPQLQSPHAPGTLEPVPDPPPLPDPASTGEQLADRAAKTLTDLSQMLGPYPFSSLALTENPNASSQGWPGLIFLSTLRVPVARTTGSDQPDAARPSNLQRSDDAARTDAPVVWRRGVVGQLSRAVAAGGACKLLLHPAAGAQSPGRRAVAAGRLSADSGEGIEGRPPPGGGGAGDAGRPAVVLEVPQRLRDRCLRARDLAHAHAARNVA